MRGGERKERERERGGERAKITDQINGDDHDRLFENINNDNSINYFRPTSMY